MTHCSSPLSPPHPVNTLKHVYKPINECISAEMETGRVEILRLAGQKPVKFSFLATKIYLSQTKKRSNSPFLQLKYI